MRALEKRLNDVESKLKISDYTGPKSIMILKNDLYPFIDLDKCPSYKRQFDEQNARRQNMFFITVACIGCKEDCKFALNENISDAELDRVKQERQLITDISKN